MSATCHANLVLLDCTSQQLWQGMRNLKLNFLHPLSPPAFWVQILSSQCSSLSPPVIVTLGVNVVQKSYVKQLHNSFA